MFHPMKSFLAPTAFFLGKLLAPFLGGCSAERADPADPPDCNDLAYNAPSLAVALASNPPPLPAGGAISEGSYELSTARLFEVPGDVAINRQLGAELDLRGDSMQWATSVDGKLTRSTSQFTVAGTTLSVVDSCPSTASRMYGFTATPTTLELHSTEAPYTLQQIFTKR